MFSCTSDTTANMPEKKRVSIAPDANGDRNKRSDAKTQGPGKPNSKRRDSKPDVAKETKRDGAKSKNLNPIQRSKENIKRTHDVRKAKGKYDSRIKSVAEEQESDRQYLVDQINQFRRDNDRMLKQQAHKFGITLDEMKHVKEELEMSKNTNDALYHEVEARKEECDKLQAELDILAERMNELTLDRYDLLHEKRINKEEIIQLQKTENKVNALMKDNKTLRMQLLKEKIDPSADASKVGLTANTIMNNSPKSDVSHRGTRGSRFPSINGRKRNASPKSDVVYYEPDEPVVYTRKSLMKIRSMEDLRPKEPPAKQTHLQRSRSYNQQTAKKGSDRRMKNDLKATKGGWK